MERTEVTKERKEVTEATIEESNEDDRLVVFTIRTDEFHPLFIVFLKDENGKLEIGCNEKYKFWRRVLEVSTTSVTFAIRKSSADLILEARCKPASWVAQEIWGE